MSFIFPNSPPFGPYTFSVGIAVFGSYWSIKSSTANMTSLYKLFSQWALKSFLVIFIFAVLKEIIRISLIDRETRVQSQVKTQKWYLIPPCLTLSIIRYGSGVKWSKPGKGVAHSPTPWCSSYRKGALTKVANFTLLTIYILFCKQAVCRRVTKIGKKAYLMRQCKIVTRNYRCLMRFETKSLLFNVSELSRDKLRSL